MTEQIRQRLGGVVLAVALLIVGLLLRAEDVEILGAVALTGAALLGLMSLANLGLDLMQGKGDRD